MTIDASIPLQARAPQPESPMQHFANALTLKDLVQRGEMGALQATREKDAMAREGAVRQVYADAGNLDSSTGDLSPEGLAKLQAADPQAAMGYRKNALGMQKERMEMEHKQAETAKTRGQGAQEAFKLLHSANDEALAAYHATLKETGDENKARAQADAVMQGTWLPQLGQTGLFPPERLKTIAEKKFDPVKAEAFRRSSISASEAIKLQNEGWHFVTEMDGSVTAVKPGTGEIRHTGLKQRESTLVTVYGQPVPIMGADGKVTYGMPDKKNATIADTGAVVPPKPGEVRAKQVVEDKKQSGLKLLEQIQENINNLEVSERMGTGLPVTGTLAAGTRLLESASQFLGRDKDNTAHNIQTGLTQLREDVMQDMKRFRFSKQAMQQVEKIVRGEGVGDTVIATTKSLEALQKHLIREYGLNDADVVKALNNASGGTMPPPPYPVARQAPGVAPEPAPQAPTPQPPAPAPAPVGAQPPVPPGTEAPIVQPLAPQVQIPSPPPPGVAPMGNPGSFAAGVTESPALVPPVVPPQSAPAPVQVAPAPAAPPPPPGSANVPIPRPAAPPDFLPGDPRSGAFDPESERAATENYRPSGPAPAPRQVTFQQAKRQAAAEGKPSFSWQGKSYPSGGKASFPANKPYLNPARYKTVQDVVKAYRDGHQLTWDEAAQLLTSKFGVSMKGGE